MLIFGRLKYTLISSGVTYMNPEIDKLAQVLKLSAYQKNVLKSHPEVYKFSGLVKRGCVLYAPRVAKSHVVLEFFLRMVYGRSADLIGEDKMLVRRTRGIDFRAHGFYSAPIGQYRYYADEHGNIIPRAQFMRETLH